MRLATVRLNLAVDLSQLGFSSAYKNYFSPGSAKGECKFPANAFTGSRDERYPAFQPKRRSIIYQRMFQNDSSHKGEFWLSLRRGDAE